MATADDEGSGKLNRDAAEYWKSLAAKGVGTPDPAGALSPRGQRRQKLNGPQSLAPIENDSGITAEALVLIVETIRENREAIKAATAEMTAARLAMGANEAQHAQRANAMARDMSTLTQAVNQLAAREVGKKQRRSDWILCVLAGVVIGVILAAFAILDLPMLWHNLFG